MRSAYLGMSTSPQTAHGCCDSHTSGQTVRQEPEFDAERVVWDADYRRDVIERLRQWRSHRTGSSAKEQQAA